MVEFSIRQWIGPVCRVRYRNVPSPCVRDPTTVSELSALAVEILPSSVITGSPSNNFKLGTIFIIESHACNTMMPVWTAESSSTSNISSARGRVSCSTRTMYVHNSRLSIDLSLEGSPVCPPHWGINDQRALPGIERHCRDARSRITSVVLLN